MSESPYTDEYIALGLPGVFECKNFIAAPSVEDVTPEMIDAGCVELGQYEPGVGDGPGCTEDIYVAMEKARLLSVGTNT